MKISLHCRGVILNPDGRAYLERRLGFALGRFMSKVTRVTVTLSDVNGDRGGIDKRCRVVTSLKGMGQIVLEDRDSSLPVLLDRISGRLDRLVSRRLERDRFVRDRMPFGGTAFG
ncbi:hypothetical protein I41_26950 [Lacipirellula limnantheis]|uniref:Sigma 54 modulation protein / S30EA ribosomal protein n=1 Tax=Lacipirellula limnantheis TaxID=2528024 RepID=A0A517TYQ9_9BACT|nr:hypothetical protein I41_26950 [Lacipirellula limnantheis]